MKKAPFAIILLVLLVLGCAAIANPRGAFTATPPVTITVMAAASLAEPFQELGGMFEAQHPGLRVEFNFAGSQQLAQQIAQGAPADVYASASQVEVQAVIDAGRVTPGSEQIFAQNQLAVIVPRGNPAGLSELSDLARPGLKLIIAAAEVPAGRYTLELLDRASQQPEYGAAFKAQVLQNVVSYESNVKSVLSKIALGEADAGVVYQSDVMGEVEQLPLADALNVMASYPMAVLQDSLRPGLAQAFVELVLSPAGQQVLIDHGLIPANP